MGLLVQGSPLVGERSVIEELQSFLKVYRSTFEEASIDLRSGEIQQISNKDLALYVNQREFAVLNGKRPSKIVKMGTDMATTCHMVVVHCKSASVAALGHFDGACTKQGVNDMMDHTLLEIMREKVAGVETVDFDLHIVGGFDDSRKLSERLSMEILKEFHCYSTKTGMPQAQINLKTFCATSLNNIKSERTISENQRICVDAPAILGIIFHVKSGELKPAVFEEKAKSPVPELRSSRSLLGVKNMPNIYRTEDDCFIIQPFNSGYFDDIETWLRAPDHIIRRYMSTSPDVEPDNFEEHIRSTLRFIYENPDPLQSIFPKLEPLVFQADMDDNGLRWQLK